MSRLVNAKAAQAVLGVSHPTFYRLVREGRLDRIPVSDTRSVYMLDQIERLKAERQRETVAARSAFASGLALGLNTAVPCACGPGNQSWIAVDEDRIACNACDLIISVASVLDGQR